MAKKKSKKTAVAAPAAPQKKVAKPAKSATAAPAPAKAAKPTEAQISSRAHQIWIGKGSPKPGTPLADWLQAERDLSS